MHRTISSIALVALIVTGALFVSGAGSSAHAYENKHWSRWAKRECRMGPYGNDSRVRDLIRCAHQRVGLTHQIDESLYIAERESGYEPTADNPDSTAAGLYQWLRSSWPGGRFDKMRRRFEFPNSRWNARAAAFVSARVMREGGCDPWFMSC